MHAHQYNPSLRFPLKDDLLPGGKQALVLELPQPPNGDVQDQAFFYRLADGQVVGYFNRCTHVAVPMDFGDACFLAPDGSIMCRLHGARYDPASGLALSGPARNHLVRVNCEIRKNELLVHGWEQVRVPT